MDTVNIKLIKNPGKKASKLLESAPLENQVKDTFYQIIGNTKIRVLKKESVVSKKPPKS